MTFLCHIRVNFKFGLLDCVLYMYNGDFILPGFVISEFCSIHFVSLAGLKNIVCHTRDFVIKGFVISRFHSTMLYKLIS